MLATLAPASRPRKDRLHERRGPQIKVQVVHTSPPHRVGSVRVRAGVEPTIRPGCFGQGCRCGGALISGQAAEETGVEELGHDPPVPGDHPGRVLVLPLLCR
jgi:hypothetical protein